MKNGKTFDGYIHFFRPEQGFLTLMGNEEKLFFKDMTSAITLQERYRQGEVRDQDEIERAKTYLQDARKYNWHGELPIQEWENESR